MHNAKTIKMSLKLSLRGLQSVIFLKSEQKSMNPTLFLKASQNCFKLT